MTDETRTPDPREQSALRRVLCTTRPIAHDLFWFLLLPISFTFAPLIAAAISAVMPVQGFGAAGLSASATRWAEDINTGLLLFSISGWLVLIGVWFFRSPDPNRNFIFYAERGMVFAILLYLWALGPTALSLMHAIFTTLTKGG